MTRRLTAHVVSHTHWDRAWYRTFAETRVRLVELMDMLLDLMVRQPDYRFFTLDGQLAMLLDYLELRPERAPEVKGLTRARRLLLGPFFVLPDLFIPDGESLVRNLTVGQRAARPFGRPMRLGYLPDPFGHPAQLPQILRGFGIDGMVFTRGMGDEGERLGSDFYWEAPDGSRVLATHQVPGGYGNLESFGEARLPESLSPLDAHYPRGTRATADAVSRARATVERLAHEMRPYCKHGLLLLNNGCDHLPPQPTLPALIEAINGARLPVRLQHSTALAYQAAVRRRIDSGAFRPRRHRGELRGARYANLLSGVLSARVDLKLAHDACERLLLRWVEPWTAVASALGLPAADDGALIEHAWRQLLLCQPHDDICGCSIDGVHDDDLNRMAQCEQIGSTLLERTLKGIVAASGEQALLFNPHPWSLPTLVALDGRRPAGADGAVQRTRGVSYCLLRPPALGWTPVEQAPAATAAPVRVGRGRAGASSLDNGIVRLRVDAAGRLSLTDRRSGLRFSRLLEPLDDGDGGDTYDYSPPARQRVVRGERPRTRVLASGPLFGEIELRYALELPIGLSADRRGRTERTRVVPLTLVVRVTAGSPRVDVECTVDNSVDDHRLRLAVSAPLQVDRVAAGGPFEVARRPVRPAPAPSWIQTPSPTHPFQGFVAIDADRGGIAVLAPGLREYESRNERGGTTVLVTLLRSIRWLSRADVVGRPVNAGPELPVEGARQRGPLRMRLALLPLAERLLDSDLMAQLRHHADPPRVVAGDGQGARAGTRAPSRAALLRLDSPQVAPTALLPGPRGSVDLRIVNLSDGAIGAALAGPWRSPRRLSLDGRAAGALRGIAKIPLRGGEISTLRLRLDRPAAHSSASDGLLIK